MVDTIRQRLDAVISPTATRPRASKPNPPLDRAVDLIAAPPGANVTYQTASAQALAGSDAAGMTQGPPRVPDMPPMNPSLDVSA
jgi:hypothetical protein